MKTAQFLTVVALCILMANARPIFQFHNARLEAVIEVLSSILLEEISADVSKEPVVEWPGNSLSEIAVQGEVLEDEEHINQKLGISEEPDVFGDVVLSQRQIELLVNGEKGQAQAFFGTRLWPGGVVPYFIETNLIKKKKIRKAIDELMDESCIQFVEITPSESYECSHQYPNCVRFFAGRGCYSNLGMVGGRQDISIGMGCTKKAGIIQHEILHALGRIHEQSRHDRDDYVDIRLNNIVRTDDHKNFDIMNSIDNSIPYDYGSIMHYPKDAFSIQADDPRYYTIVPRTKGVRIGQRNELSERDWEHLRKMYCASPDQQTKH